MLSIHLLFVSFQLASFGVPVFSIFPHPNFHILLKDRKAGEIHLQTESFF